MVEGYEGWPDCRGRGGASPLQDDSVVGSDRGVSEVLAPQEQHIRIGHGRPASEASIDALLYGGHSPRSGLPSLVQEMNLDEDVYKKFGRWSSSAYQLYLKDQEAMRKGREAVAARCQSLAWAITASE